MPAVFQDPTVPEYYTRIGGVRTKAIFTASDLSDTFIDADGSVALTANWDVGAFDIRAATLTPDGITLGSVMFAGTNGVISQDNSNLFWDDTNKFLGLGTSGAPAATLDVLRIVTDTSGSFNASSFALIVFPGSASSAVTNALNLVAVPIGAQDITGQISGAIFGFGNLNTGTITAAVGLQLNFRNQGAGIITSGIGGIFNLENLSTGIITTGTCGQFNIANSNAGGLINTVYGSRVTLTNSGTLANTFGFYVGDITDGTQTNTPFSFYAEDTGTHNYFAGDLAIGTLNFPSTGDSFLIFGDGTVPATMGTNTAGLFANDVSGIVNMFAINEADRLTRLNGPFAPLGANLEETQIEFVSIELTGLSGATVTATNLVPAGSFIIGVTIRVTTTITGATTFDVGDGSDVDRWGAAILLPAGTTTSIVDFTANGFGQFTTANNVVLTVNGADFSAGAIRITVHYINLVAATS